MLKSASSWKHELELLLFHSKMVQKIRKYYCILWILLNLSWRVDEIKFRRCDCSDSVDWEQRLNVLPGCYSWLEFHYVVVIQAMRDLLLRYRTKYSLSSLIFFSTLLKADWLSQWWSNVLIDFFSFSYLEYQTKFFWFSLLCLLSRFSLTKPLIQEQPPPLIMIEMKLNRLLLIW